MIAPVETVGEAKARVRARVLAARLGVTWTAARNGISEIEGVPRDAIDAFSRRRAEIDAQVAEWGRDSAAARQSAAVQTRKRKDYNVTPDELAPEWRARELLPSDSTPIAWRASSAAISPRARRSSRLSPRTCARAQA